MFYKARKIKDGILVALMICGNALICTTLAWFHQLKAGGSFELIYYEACQDKGDAYAREKYLKSGMGKRYLKNRLKRSLPLTG